MPSRSAEIQLNSSSNSASSSPRLGLRANWQQFTLLVIVNAFVGAMVGLERTVVPLIAESDFGLTSKSLTLSFIVGFGIVKALANLFAGRLSDRIGRRPIMIIGCFGSVITSLAVLYFHGPIWMLAGFMFIGWVGNGIFPMFMGTIPGESLPRAHIATAMGIVVGIGEILGGVAAPFIAGRLSDATSLGKEAPLFLMAASAIIAGIIALFLKETAPAKLAKLQAAVAPMQKAA